MRSWNSRSCALIAATLLTAASACTLTYDFDRDPDAVDPADVVGRTISPGDALPFARVDVVGTQTVQRSAADANFAVTQLPSGVWTLRFNHDANGDGVSELHTLRQVLQVERTFVEGEAFPAYNIDLGDVQLDGLGQVRGEVELDGNAVVGAEVVVIETHSIDNPLTDAPESIAQNTGIVARGVTDARGQYYLRDVPPLPVGVTAAETGGLSYQLFAFYTDVDELTVSDPTTVVVEAGRELEQNIQLAAPAAPFEDVTVPVQLVNVDVDSEIRVLIYDHGTDTLTQPNPLLDTGVSVDGNQQVEIPVPVATPVDIYFSTPTLGGALYGQLVLPETTPLLGPVAMTPHDACAAHPGVVLDSLSSDCDGDGANALPPLSPSAGGGFTGDVDTWIECAAQCTGGGATFAATATCTVGGTVYDCDDDGDGQFDGSEPLACQVFGAGGDADGDGICDAADPFPLCPDGYTGPDDLADCVVFPPEECSVLSPTCDETPVGGIPGFDPFLRSLATGDGHTCFLNGGVAYCWGLNQLGQVGAPPLADGSASPVVYVRDGTTADDPNVDESLFPQAIAAGGDSTCVINEGLDDKVYCWGEIAQDETFAPDHTGRARGVGRVGTPNDGLKFGEDISVGGASACAVVRENAAVDAARELWCWGAPLYAGVGASGLAYPINTGDAAVTAVWRNVATGKQHACVSDEVGVVCFGANDESQSGGSATATNVIPRRVGVAGDDDAQNPLRLDLPAVGRTHTCAIETKSGGLYCWGSNADGRLGLPLETTGPIGTATRASAFDAWYATSHNGVAPFVTYVAAGDEHTCVVARPVDDEENGAREVICFGSNDQGALGAADGQRFVVQPRSTENVAPPFVVDSLAAGQDHACASYPAALQPVCFGQNEYATDVNGQLDGQTNLPSFRRWRGTASDDCGDPNNWQPAVLPDGSTSVVLTATSGDLSFTTACTEAWSIGSLRAADGFSQTVHVDDGATLQVDGYLEMAAGAVLDAPNARIEVDIALSAGGDETSIVRLYGDTHLDDLMVRSPSEVVVAGPPEQTRELTLEGTGHFTVDVAEAVMDLILVRPAGPWATDPADCTGVVCATLVAAPDRTQGVSALTLVDNGDASPNGDDHMQLVLFNAGENPDDDQPGEPAFFTIGNGGLSLPDAPVALAFGNARDFAYLQLQGDANLTAGTVYGGVLQLAGTGNLSASGIAPLSGLTLLPGADYTIVGALAVNNLQHGGTLRVPVGAGLALAGPHDVSAGARLALEGGDITANTLTVDGTLTHGAGSLAAVALAIRGAGAMVDDAPAANTTTVSAPAFDAVGTSGPVQLPNMLQWTETLTLPAQVEHRGGDVVWGLTEVFEADANVVLPGGLVLNNFVIEAPDTVVAFGGVEDRCGGVDLGSPTDFVVEGVLRLQGDAGQPLTLQGAEDPSGQTGGTRQSYFLSVTDSTIMEVSETMVFDGTNRNVFRSIPADGDYQSGFGSSCGDSTVDAGLFEECDGGGNCLPGCVLSDTSAIGVMIVAVWIGGGAEGDWNDLNNWSGTSMVPGQAGQSVAFPANATGTIAVPEERNLTAVNMEPGTSVVLELSGTNDYGGAFRHDGGEVVLSAGASLSADYLRSNAPPSDGGPSFRTEGAATVTVRGNAYFGPNVDLTGAALNAAALANYEPRAWAAREGARLGALRIADGMNLSSVVYLGGAPRVDSLEVRSDNSSGSTSLRSMRDGSQVIVDGSAANLELNGGSTFVDIDLAVGGNYSSGTNVNAEGTITMRPDAAGRTVTSGSRIDTLVLDGPVTFNRGLNANRVQFTSGTHVISDSDYDWWLPPTVLQVSGDADVTFADEEFVVDGTIVPLECLRVDGDDASLSFEAKATQLHARTVQARRGRFHPPDTLVATHLSIAPSANYEHRCGDVRVEGFTGDFTPDPSTFPVSTLDLAGQTLFAVHLDSKSDLSTVEWVGGVEPARILGMLVSNHPPNLGVGDSNGGRLVAVDNPMLIDATGLVSVVTGQVDGLHQVGLGYLGAATSGQVTESSNFTIPDTCGNNVRDDDEECDNNSTAFSLSNPVARSFDGCSDACTLEPGYVWSDVTNAVSFEPTCGNGIVEIGFDGSGEQCDTAVWTGDASHVGPQTQTDYCSNVCTRVGSGTQCDGCGPRSCFPQSDIPIDD